MGRRTKVMGGVALALGVLDLTGGHALAQESVRRRFQESALQKMSWQEMGDTLGPEMAYGGAPAPMGLPGGILSQAKGQVLRVDGDGRTLILRLEPAGQTVDFWVAPRALVAQGRYPLEVADLEVGDWVRVVYSTSRGNRIAEEVRIQ